MVQLIDSLLDLSQCVSVELQREPLGLSCGSEPAPHCPIQTTEGLPVHPRADHDEYRKASEDRVAQAAGPETRGDDCRGISPEAVASGQREQIELAQRLWEVECRHLLGALPTPQYRQALAALLDSRANVSEPAVENILV
jgi:hypothetical protein